MKYAVIVRELPYRMYGENNMEQHVNADLWSNNDTGGFFFWQ